MNQEQLVTLSSLEKRKWMVEIKEEKTTEVKITDFGRKVANSGTKGKEMIEQITSEILKKILHGKGKSSEDMTLIFQSQQ